MAKPGKYDREQGHPEGQFDVGGVDAFRELPWIKDLAAGSFHLWEGFVPECFDKYTGPDQFSLVIIDFDHYEPTREGLRWAWPRLSSGGIALLDDVDFGWEQESTRAVNEFLRKDNQFSILDHYNHQLIIKKIERSP